MPIVHLTRRYGFPASHRLHSPYLSDAQNAETFGKCNNPHGHGHNYEVELTVGGEVDSVTGRVIDLAALDALAEKEILKPFRYRDLNKEVEAFRNSIPTAENLALEVERRLRGVWGVTFPAGAAALEKVRIRETERNICEISNGK